MKIKTGIFSLFLVTALLSSLTPAQERVRTVRQSKSPPPASQSAQDGVEDVLRVRTRVVFIDTLVKDGKTNQPARDLKAEDFQVLDDGRPRKLSYFTGEGDSRRPLALLLFIDLWTPYGRSLLKDPDAMARLASALTKLAPDDEVAVMSTWVDEGEVPGTPLATIKMIEGFTRDRAKTYDALVRIPELIRQQEIQIEQIARMRGRESGDLLLDIVWRLSEVADEVVPLATRMPNSQFVVVGLIADLFDLRKGERDEVAESALRAGITFNALVFKKSTAGKLFFGTFNKLFLSPRGLSLHAADYLAKQTGGEVASAGRAGELASGLEGFISNLMASYSLGFTLEEEERDDGRLHTLEVRINKRDARGRRRNLTVKARRGYYSSPAQ